MVRSAATGLYLLVLSVWFGGGALYTFVVTPVIFRAYRRDMAGEIVGALMPTYFRLTLAMVAAALVLFLFLWRAWPARARPLALALLLTALALQGFVNFSLYPRIAAVKKEVISFESEPEAPARRRFRALHGVSMLVNLATLAEGSVLILLASLPKR